MARIDRRYFTRRALQEIACSKRAGPIEAKIAHAKLAGLHVRRCASFEAHKTPECLGCPLAFICNDHAEANRASASAVLACSASVRNRIHPAASDPDMAAGP